MWAVLILLNGNSVTWRKIVKETEKGIKLEGYGDYFWPPEMIIKCDTAKQAGDEYKKRSVYESMTRK